MGLVCRQVLLLLVIVCTLTYVAAAHGRGSRGGKGRGWGRGWGRGRGGGHRRWRTTPTPTPALPPCGSTDNFYTPDPKDCLKFYQCYNGKYTHFTCPEGGIWTNDATQPACLMVGPNDPRVVCGSRPYNPPENPAVFINLTINVVDTNGNPPINVTVSEVLIQANLYTMMLQVAALNANFWFTSTFHPIWWRSINCINAVCSAGTYYWQISVGGTSIPVGVSSYIPADGTTVKFEYVSWAG